MNNTPSTEIAKRIAILFQRRLTTAWDEKEIKQYKKLAKSGAFDDPDDLRLIECYYVFERRKEDKGIQRRDLYTFLNHFQGELDRARAWRKRYPITKETKIDREIKIPTDEEWLTAKELVAQELKKFRESMMHK